jgi:membrane-associated phospholipid phosphatase
MTGRLSRALGSTLVIALHQATAQSDTAAARLAPRAVWLLGGTLIVGALAADAAVERASLANRSPTLDDAARIGDALGAGRHLLPALGAGYLAGRVLARRRLADGALHTAVAYALGNIVVSAGKPFVGRHRPDTTGSPWRFHPFTSRGSYHSWPSAHTVHAFTIAGAVAEESHARWVTASAYSAAAVVGWSRLYADEHWASDVASSAVVGAVIGHATVRVWRERSKRRSGTREGHSATLGISPDGRLVVIRLDW